MAAKKERGRFSLRFNISDPIHLATVELLEKQPDHGKAQYIANAVVFYDTHFADDPQPLRAAAPAIDRAAIEAIVREILLQETRHSEKPAAACPDAETTTAPVPQERTPEPEYVPELGEEPEADDAILGLISSTMEAFRQGR
ncbi:hypothetical protein H9X86_00380 [Pseudoflavonifractor capillosus]|uniref:hypothetical protein n=1 Tax=Pseudoflavonifractor capillosus TaxID=106588 RepID=UPI00195E8F33|nr:hypothetical protein [Pseudoflavonifractor capillosus]MBM6895830.1 hypothetical protein [Pseudoflavonifractor capillosus]